MWLNTSIYNTPTAVIGDFCICAETLTRGVRHVWEKHSKHFHTLNCDTNILRVSTNDNKMWWIYEILKCLFMLLLCACTNFWMCSIRALHFESGILILLAHTVFIKSQIMLSFHAHVLPRVLIVVPVRILFKINSSCLLLLNTKFCFTTCPTFLPTKPHINIINLPLNSL